MGGKVLIHRADAEGLNNPNTPSLYAGPEEEEG